MLSRTPSMTLSRTPSSVIRRMSVRSNLRTVEPPRTNRRRAVAAMVQLRLCNRLSVSLSFIGLAVQLALNEYAWAALDPDPAALFAGQCVVSALTVLLLFATTLYHRVQYVSWRRLWGGAHAGGGRMLATAALELLVKAIHPPPGLALRSANLMPPEPSAAPGDGASRPWLLWGAENAHELLSTLMLLRLLMVVRTVWLESHMLDDKPRILARVSQVPLTPSFAFRVRIERAPFTSLLLLSTYGVIALAYAYHLCEREAALARGEPEGPFWSPASFPNCVWLVLITFTTVGFGDVFPNTWGGRIVVLATSLFGITITSIITGIMAGHLKLEEYEARFIWLVDKSVRDRELQEWAVRAVQRRWRARSLALQQQHAAARRSSGQSSVGKRGQPTLVVPLAGVAEEARESEAADPTAAAASPGARSEEGGEGSATGAPAGRQGGAARGRSTTFSTSALAHAAGRAIRTPTRFELLVELARRDADHALGQWHRVRHSPDGSHELTKLVTYQLREIAHEGRDSERRLGARIDQLATAVHGLSETIRRMQGLEDGSASAPNTGRTSSRHDSFPSMPGTALPSAAPRAGGAPGSCTRGSGSFTMRSSSSLGIGSGGGGRERHPTS